jgi:hypothetical protein
MSTTLNQYLPPVTFAVPSIEERGVFLNVPFDLSYQPLFLAIITTLISIGYYPRCVLEIAETGQGRLHRIIKHLESCKFSIHDLSRVSTPPRYNMPFELGLAYSIRKYSVQPSQYCFIILESKPHRFIKTLSDMSAYDPHIH